MMASVCAPGRAGKSIQEGFHDIFDAQKAD